MGDEAGDAAGAVENADPDEPQVFGVDVEAGEVRLTRRRFRGAATAGAAALGVVLGGCLPPGGSATPHRSSATPTPTPTPRTSPTSTPRAGDGTIPPGVHGSELLVGGHWQWQACDMPLPTGATCVCDCVTGAQGCTCDTVCSCDGDCSCDTVCSCDGACSCAGASHYWHPN